MTEEIPKDSSHTRLVVLVSSGVVVVLVVGGVALWSLTHSPDAGPKQTRIEPAQETSVAPLPGIEASGSAESSATTPSSIATPVVDPAGETAVVSPETTGARRIAFTLGATLYVSDPGGAQVQPMTAAADSYALSPDGTKLAVVMGHGASSAGGSEAVGDIAVIDVATKSVINVGADAIPLADAIAWAPDASWLVYTARIGGELAVKRVGADGAGDEVLAAPGGSPRVSRDGGHVAYRRSGQPDYIGPLWVIAVGSTDARAVPQGDEAHGWGWGPKNRLYFTRSGHTPQDGDLWRYTVGAGSSKRVGSIGFESPAYALYDLRVSPDGTKVFMAAGGDDHYSRLWVFDASATRFSAIQSRRDAYPCCWASNDQILYFEGNSYQGEPSALASILVDGTGRRLIVTGARR